MNSLHILKLGRCDINIACTSFFPLLKIFLGSRELKLEGSNKEKVRVMWMKLRTSKSFGYATETLAVRSKDVSILLVSQLCQHRRLFVSDGQVLILN